MTDASPIPSGAESSARSIEVDDPAAARVLRRWLAVAPAGPGRDDPDLTEAATDLVLAVAGDSASWGAVRQGPTVAVSRALERFGRTLGRLGWPLSDIARWVAQLPSLTDGPGPRLDGFEAAVSLGSGWTNGTTDTAAQLVSAITGLPSVAALGPTGGQSPRRLLVVSRDPLDDPIADLAGAATLADVVSRSFPGLAAVALDDHAVAVETPDGDDVPHDTITDGLALCLSVARRTPPLDQAGVHAHVVRTGTDG